MPVISRCRYHLGLCFERCGLATLAVFIETDGVLCNLQMWKEEAKEIVVSGRE